MSGEGTVRQRIGASGVALASALACRLPEPPLVGLAELIGELWYRLAPARAARARRNLARVVGWMAAAGVGPERRRRAAHDPAELEHLVRLAFRHQARYYLEVLRTPGITAETIDARLDEETPEVIAEAFRTPGSAIFVGLHFGAIELPALYAAQRSGRVATAPMETIDDAPLQRWFARTRSSVGVHIVSLGEARHALIDALRRGDPVGLVADRDLTGGGIPTPFFGSVAPMPAGPALIALETGARCYVTWVRRAGRRYRGGLEPVDLPATGSRRERVEAFLRAEAEAFQRVIASAPEQWWGAFFPIWPDLEGTPVRARARSSAASRPSAAPVAPAASASDSSAASRPSGAPAASASDSSEPSGPADMQAPAGPSATVREFAANPGPARRPPSRRSSPRREVAP